MVKDYVLELSRPMDAVINDILIENKCNVVFHDDLLPHLVIVECDFDSLQGLSFISKVRESRVEGQLLANKKPSIITKANMKPDIDITMLKEMGYGFGSKIAILDCGISEEMRHEVEIDVDFTGYGRLPKVPHGDIVLGIIKHFSKASQVYAAKVCHEDGVLKELHVFKALKWAKEQNVNIINLSIGYDCNCDGSCDLAAYIKAISEKFEILFVAAAGNNPNASCFCPGCSEDVITVGLLSKDGESVEQRSSHGHRISNKPNLVTSGQGDMLSHGYIGPFIGTSFAAPVVTGILSVLVSYTTNVETLKMKLYEATSSLEGASVFKQGLGKLELPKLLEVLYNEKRTNSASSEN